MSFADKTSVPVTRTRVEIETMLTKAGASKFATAFGDSRAEVYFELNDRAVKFRMPLPELRDIPTRSTGKYRWSDRPVSAREAELQQRLRSAWRALLLTIKAKLVSVDQGVETFEEAFLAHLVVPGSGGKTVGQEIMPKLEMAYRDGLPSGAPLLMLGPGE